MADQIQAFGVTVGDDGQIGILLDQIRGIDQRTIDLAGQRGAGKTSADTGGDLGDRHRILEGTNGTVGQFDIRHDRPQGKKKVRGEPHFSGRTKADSVRVSER